MPPPACRISVSSCKAPFRHVWDHFLDQPFCLGTSHFPAICIIQVQKLLHGLLEMPVQVAPAHAQLAEYLVHDDILDIDFRKEHLVLAVHL